MIKPRLSVRRAPHTMASFVLPILLLLLIPVSTSHVFLPRRQTKLKPSSTSTWLASDHDAFRYQRQRHKLVGFATRRLQLLRGGADAEYLDLDVITAEDNAEDVGKEEELASSVSVVNDVTVMESTSTVQIDSTGSSSSSDPSNIQSVIDDNDSETPNNIDETVYATIGVLNVPTTLGDNSILLGYKCNDNPNDQIHERWGIQQDLSATQQSDNDIALAEIHGCLSHGIVLNLSQKLFDSEGDTSQSIASQDLDDVLLGIAEGIIRRLKGTEPIQIPLYITFEDVQQSDETSEIIAQQTTDYINEYMELALSRLGQLHIGNHHIPERLDNDDDDVSVDKSILGQCQVVPIYSGCSASETAAILASTILEQNSDKEISMLNIVPLSLFGILCNQMYKEISKSRLSLDGYDNNSGIVVEWKKLSEDTIIKKEDASSVNNGEEVGEATESSPELIEMESISTELNEREEVTEVTESSPEIEMESISSELRQRVQSEMAMAFVDVEESLLELESKMDEAILNFDSEDESVEKHPTPDFSSDVDAIFGAMSDSFLALVNEFEAMNESEKEWLELQRIEAIKQVAGTSVLRLFNLHLQSLRDHFGLWYERTLESCVGDFAFDAEPQSDWKIQSQRAAKQAEEGFMKAAFGSIPKICQHPDGELCNELVGIFTCAEALHGLLEDMFEVTSLRGMDEEEWNAIMSADEEDGASVDLQATKTRVGLRQLIKNVKAKVQKRGPAKWYERLALKGLVIGVNFIQGWIALQVLRREARKRDLAMPKFPLF